MAYSELIKNFEKVRSYMRDFYIFGFRSREEFGRKSPRSYDDERRRIEGYLQEYMGFHQTDAGKNVFISVDSRNGRGNPFYRALKTCSFTSGDITLHFIIFDILSSADEKMTVSQLADIIYEDYLSHFEAPVLYDISTVRKKLDEYVKLGLINKEKKGREVFYSRCPDTDLTGWDDALEFFSETAPCGVVGSYIMDAENAAGSRFAFKHHYITQALDSEILYSLFEAMHEKAEVTVSTYRRDSNEENLCLVVPLRIYISVGNGRQYLMCYNKNYRCFDSFRLDHIKAVRAGEVSDEFDGLRERLREIGPNIWGVVCNRDHHLEHVEFVIRASEKEAFIVERLEREKRSGEVEALGGGLYRFSADVFDTYEMVPWIRTFICRIVELDFSNSMVESQFRSDIEAMYELYDIPGGEE